MSEPAVAVLLDENVERRVGEYLRTEGYDVEHVVDALGAGAGDAAAIAPYAREHARVVLTKDTDFLRMDDSEHAGVLFLDSHRASAYDVAMAVVDVTDALERETLRGVVYLDGWL